MTRFFLTLRPEMVQTFILVPVLLSFLILFLPSRMRFPFTFTLLCGVILLTSIDPVRILSGMGQEISYQLFFLSFASLKITIDSLSAFFILLMNLVLLAGLIYSKGYLSVTGPVKNDAQIALHYFSFAWLYFSMLGVVMLREGIPFLIAWELMAVSSFLLILFEAEKRETLKTAVNYLVQMHVGMVLLLIAFLWCEAETGKMDFDVLGIYFSSHPNTGLFFLFFTGFAMKAGFMPFHTWLPSAHPAAPSHISAFMSGVMIKMGLYGILRVLTHLQSDYLLIGTIILALSAFSGLSAVLMALVHRDLKKVLAYSSIENIGIIGMGIGIGTIGIGLHQNWMILTGFAGAFLHIFNHALFKPLLFFAAGGVYRQTHTRNMEELGGLIRFMPRTAMAFLTGSVAISGLPPLSGFLAEVLIFLGMIQGLGSGSVYLPVVMILGIIALSLISGYSIFAFTRAFGITFLGSPRTILPGTPSENGNWMVGSQIFLILLILTAGIFPLLFLWPIISIILNTYSPALLSEALMAGSLLARLSVFNAVLLILITGLFLLRRQFTLRNTPSYGPTWGCGYTAGTARQQYTGASFSGNIAELAQPLLQTSETTDPIHATDFFPESRNYRADPSDFFTLATDRLSGYLMIVLKKLARLQTGNIQHYILYAFLFILVVFLLLYLNIL